MRFFISLMLSIPMIFSVFLLMAHLLPTAADEKVIIDPPLPDFKAPQYDQTLKIKKLAKLPEPPPPAVMPTNPTESHPVDQVTETEIPNIVEHPGIGNLQIWDKSNPVGPRHQSMDAEAVPEMTIEPVWPANADRSGEVRFCFAVDPNGRVSDIQLIRSSPGTLFVRSAKRAIKKWRFRPAIQNGVAVHTERTCYTMAFEYQGR